MSTLREHIEEILTETTITEYQQPPSETLANIADHAIAVMAILDFKPLDSDLPEKRPDGWLQTELERAKRDAAQIPHWMRSNEGESYPPTTT